jgi:hypothetical protein
MSILITIILCLLLLIMIGHVARVAFQPYTKKCPHCREDIRLGAKICSHCRQSTKAGRYVASAR